MSDDGAKASAVVDSIRSSTEHTVAAVQQLALFADVKELHHFAPGAWIGDFFAETVSTAGGARDERPDEALLHKLQQVEDERDELLREREEERGMMYDTCTLFVDLLNKALALAKPRTGGRRATAKEKDFEFLKMVVTEFKSTHPRHTADLTSSSEALRARFNTWKEPKTTTPLTRVLLDQMRELKDERQKIDEALQSAARSILARSEGRRPVPPVTAFVATTKPSGEASGSGASDDDGDDKSSGEASGSGVSDDDEDVTCIVDPRPGVHQRIRRVISNIKDNTDKETFTMLPSTKL